MKKFLFLFFFAGVHPACGLIFYESANPPVNTETAPTGIYANGGWQHQVVLSRGSADYFGTIISPKHFVTARHIGVGIAGTDDQVYVTQPDYLTGTVEKIYTLKNATAPRSIVFFDTALGINRASDLYVYEIWETFPAHAELYTGTDESGKELVMTGFGDSRGAPVVTAEGERGWNPDASARKGRWGTNTADGTVQTNASSSQGLLLYCDFDAQGISGSAFDPEDADATLHECQAANKDSGGAWFIEEDGIWKLAGINLGVDTYGTSAGATGNRWAIYDGIGLYHGDSEVPIAACSRRGGCDFYRRSHTYATRVSEHVTAMNTVIQSAKDTALLSSLGRFDAWAQEHGLAAGTLTDGDADADGFSNVMEYLTESDPNDGNEVVRPLVVEVLPDGTHQFTLVESLDLVGRELTTTLQSSSDLGAWAMVSDVTEGSNTLDNTLGVRTRVLARTPSEMGALYYRLKITLTSN